MNSTKLPLSYNHEEDFVGIQKKLIEAPENVEHIKFDTGLYPIGPEHFCKIIKEILSKPNIKKITYEVQFEDDTNFEDFPVNLTVKKLDLSYFINTCNFTSWIWKKIFEATPNVEEIEVLTYEDFIELPQILRNLNVFKELKILNVSITIQEMEAQEKRLVAEEAMEVLKKEFPMKVKASVAILLEGHLEDNSLILIDKEANENPKLII